MATTNLPQFEPPHPVSTAKTAGMGLIPTHDPAPESDDLYKKGIPEPKGINPEEEARAKDGQSTDPTTGTGTEGEIDVWQSRYSHRNFIGRIVFRAVLTVAVLALAVYTWGMKHDYWRYATWTALAIVGLLWFALFYRMVQAHYSHFYRLTNRRLFVSTGVINRRRDMMELLMVKDVFTRQQSLLERWLSLGSVVVVPSDKSQPTFYVTGVDNPKEVMDLIWHHARTERDLRSVKVEDI
jgi:membrane protein YdbS with pleckstrin-like domain